MKLLKKIYFYLEWQWNELRWFVGQKPPVCFNVVFRYKTLNCDKQTNNVLIFNCNRYRKVAFTIIYKWIDKLCVYDCEFKHGLDDFENLQEKFSFGDSSQYFLSFLLSTIHHCQYLVRIFNI